jgi:hypothetical protein
MTEKKNSQQHPLLLLQLQILGLVHLSETPLLRNDDLLATGELVSGTAKSLHDDRRVRLLASDGKDDLANVDTGNGAVGLAPCTTHTSLETAPQHSSVTIP